MAYSAPELLLVGAAQNLVLEGSAAENTGFLCNLKEYDDEDFVLYDAIDIW